MLCLGLFVGLSVNNVSQKLVEEFSFFMKVLENGTGNNC